jgi:DNA-binding NarL/FixJ family response regulator
MNRPIQIVIVEDQWMIRDGLATLAGISESIEVVATGANGREAIALAEEHRPNVILMDIKMPGMDGIDATREIKQRHPSINVLMLTTFEQDGLIRSSLEAGAIGYLTKDIVAEDLAQAIVSASAGIVQLTQSVAASLLPFANTTPVDASMQRLVDKLTSRERDVLRLLATGATNPQIGRKLHLSAGTVKNHVSSILRQLMITDRTQAAVIATNCNV